SAAVSGRMKHNRTSFHDALDHIRPKRAERILQREDILRLAARGWNGYDVLGQQLLNGFVSGCVGRVLVFELGWVLSDSRFVKHGLRNSGSGFRWHGVVLFF